MTEHEVPQPPLQPLLHDREIVLRAPTQVWSGAGGEIGAAPIDGVYHGDVRHVRAVALTCDESPIEWISTARHGASRVVFSGLLRGVDDPMPDPRVRLTRERRVEAGAVRERITLRNGRDVPVQATLRVRVLPEFASLHAVKAGEVGAAAFEALAAAGSAVVAAGAQRFTLVAATGTVRAADDLVEVEWALAADARGEVGVEWSIALADDALVVRPASRRAPWDAAALAASVAGAEPRLARWLETALDDLDALRLALPDHPSDEFYAAGAPWFLTLFGRDSIWAARLMLPVDREIAASTLRVLARLQSADDDPEAAQEPGKILHELRATALEIPGEGVTLPPRYYGSVDATPLWICLLADAWRAGMPDDEVRALLPALRRALTWLTEHGDSDGDGFVDYLDRSGRGLANQGWKDSGDSIQWRDGSLARGPIALCEVQGYAYEAALSGAELLERFGEGDAAPLREWAATLRARFAEAYWVDTPEGRYPAVALDRDKRAVDTLTSNIGHLLGTGILDAEDERRVAALLLGPGLASGFGVRTMSTGARAYWPLSYHGGSVWTHDTAIAVHGMMRAGLPDAAREAASGMLAAAEGFGYRVPELHGGDGASETAVPTPYPAACRPQAWSAAAAVVAWSAIARE
ncbi:glycogen debranching N-terminal domain-containing protein [Microbacterium marinilacus]|uniref:Amylo-alpha-1,6-glucosidase n=1 Tax=Microbacterium marinilacus TaxID=415209 RepID=A0ABP7B5Z8_9MICO|nr:glycogen debranching N-terminal domain-containing protein [Microbacterium marinilacus]MBY0687569.1 amylo-alpha-1,6-glucosidase [Microbacterium marinilacus]